MPEQSRISKLSNKPFVVRAPDIGQSDASLEKMVGFFSAHADTIKRQLREEGVLLFRGLPLSQPSEYERILEALEYDLYRTNYGGASPRSNVTQKTFVSTEAPAPFIIGLHTEFCYQTTRPEMISFFCVEPAAGYGETPLFDLSAIWRALDAPLRERLLKDGLLYRRRFFAEKSWINFHKTWRETFATEDKSVVEAFLKGEGMSFQWDERENLSTELRVPAALTDPVTGDPCLSITMFNADSIVFNLRHFKERYPFALRKALEWFVRYEYRDRNAFLQVLHGDGQPFTKAENHQIQRAAWAHAVVFPWRKGDLLLIDNVRFGHARLNVRKPRRLIAAMANAYDVRDRLMHAPDFYKNCKASGWQFAR
jgi:alpha-ketoglutarate-dependent taurine dioxygenase